MKIIEFSKNKAATLSEAVKEELESRQYLHGVSLCNTYGKTPEQLFELNLQYAEAQVRHNRAVITLNDIIAAQSSHVREIK